MPTKWLFKAISIKLSEKNQHWQEQGINWMWEELSGIKQVWQIE